jgi:hypothetical protein
MTSSNSYIGGKPLNPFEKAFTFLNGAKAKRHLFHALLFFHFLGLALSLGTRFASLAVERATRGSSLQNMALGRDLIDASARSLTRPGLLLLVITGVCMTLLRYGLRPPVWVWIKVGAVLSIGVLGLTLAGPAAERAGHWAHWSAEHGRLAPQFLANFNQAGFYGGIIGALFLFTIAVAVWKPFSSGFRRKLQAKPDARLDEKHMAVALAPGK